MSFDPDDGLAYWKRWFDDDRRNKMEKERITIKYIEEDILNKKPPITYRTHEQHVIGNMKGDLIAYKQLFKKEQEESKRLRLELYEEKQKTLNYRTQLNQIKKCLRKTDV